MTLVQEATSVAAILGLTQSLVALRFSTLLRGERRQQGRFAPEVSLIVPCKGTVEGFMDNVRSLIDQAYPGKSEVLFVAPSESDPSVSVLRKMQARVVVSNRTPQRCSGKIVDLLFALERISDSSEVLVFADSDARVGRDWLEKLVSALADPQTGVATSATLFTPKQTDFWTLMRSVWVSAGIPYLALLECASGQSLAIRRKDFNRWGVAEVWSDSLMEDLALSELLRRRNAKIRFIGEAMPFSEAACTAHEYFSVFNKWMAVFRVYDPFLWILSVLAVLAHAYVVIASVYRGGSWLPITVMIAGDTLYLLELRLIYLRLEKRRLPWAGVLTSPLLWMSYALQMVYSFWARDVRWGGRTYRVHGPQRIEVLP